MDSQAASPAAFFPTKTNDQMPHSILNLTDLVSYCTLSPIRCAAFAEAASVCLESQEHQSGTRISVSGNYNTGFYLTWTTLDDNTKSSYILEEAVEDGAYGLAILVIRQLTPYKVIKQSFRGTGFDYWLGEHDDFPPFQEKARLEVSGILKGTAGQLNWRMNEKIKQTTKSDGTKKPAFIAIVEFSQPICKIIKR